MLPDKKHLIYLFRRYLQGTISDKETKELFAYIRESKDQEPLKDQIINVFREVTVENDSENVDWENMFSQIIKRQAAKGTKVKPFLKRIAAAVLILLIGSFATYLLIKQNKTPTYVANEQLKKTDPQPGGNKAVLTLANGKQIILDSVQNGSLTKQGNTNVVKVSSGLLAYQAKGKNLPAESVEQAGLKAKSPPSYNTLSTPLGGQYQLVLPDGTKVWLNAASSIRYPTAFTGKERRVEITGEAYFEISPLPASPKGRGDAIPFIVIVDGMKVEVLGTHFNVNAYENEPEIKVTLLEGRVRVQSGVNSWQSAVIVPGEQAKLSTDGGIELVKNADIEKVIAWKNGLFVFHNDDLGSIMRKLGRWYDVEVSYEGNKIASSHFTGAIRRQVNLSEVLKMLELTGGAHFEIEGRKVIVSP